jgi:hypothetical protein
VEPTPKAVTGGGKSAKGIAWARLESQQKSLSANLKAIQEDNGLVEHSGKIHLLVKMFDDSLAPSWTPNDLFETNSSTRIVSPAYNGFLVETSKDRIPEIIKKINVASTDRVKVDISRLKKINGFGKNEILRDKNENEIYGEETNTDKQFNVWALPFHDAKARISVVDELEELLNDGVITFGDSSFDNVFSKDMQDISRISFSKKLNHYLASGYLSFTAVIKSRDDFKRLIGSGAIYRIEPVKPITTKSIPPGDGKEPSPKMINKENAPVVVIVDGGCSAQSYAPLNVLSIQPLIDLRSADLKHGNRVTSLVCQ